MPTFEIFGAQNGRVHEWDRYENYDLIKASSTSWRLVWDEAENGPLDAERTPAEMRLVINDGVITRINYLADDGTLLARMSGLSMKASFFAWAVSDDGLNSDDIFDLLSKDGLVVTGGQQANNQWDHHDDITTSRWNDVVSARSGNDHIKDEGGTDTYKGGSGWDTVSYDQWQWIDGVRARGIVADLDDGKVKGPDGRTDTLSGIEGIRGTFLNDTLRGSSKDEYFQGGRGADVIKGGGGSDHAGYWDKDGGPGVKVNLRTGVAIDQFGTRDSLVSIEGIGGSQGNDVLTDNGKRNDLIGENGNDRLIFSGGDDYGRGDGGADRFIFKGTDFGNDFIQDFDGGDGDRIVISAADGLGDLNITSEDGGTRITLNGRSSVFLEDVTSSVESYLIFA